MKIPFPAPSPILFRLLGTLLFASAVAAQEGAPPLPAEPPAPMPYDEPTTALRLARAYLEGGESARPALLEALERMGWSVRDASGSILHSPPPDADTGLAMRDYEIDELLWNPLDQPSIRLISLAQAFSVPFAGTDSEELAQTLVETIRRSAVSDQAQQRFWAHFIIALGRASPANYDLSAPAPAAVIPPDYARIERLQTQAMQDPMSLIEALQPKPLWPEDDPVLAPSPLPERTRNTPARESTAQRDERRMEEIPEEMMRLTETFATADAAAMEAAQAKMAVLNAEMAAISHRMQAANLREMAADRAIDGNGSRLGGAGDDDDDENYDEEATARFLAEWREQPLSLLQVALITRVLAADVRLATNPPAGQRSLVLQQSLRGLRSLPLASLQVAQAAPDLGQQFAGAAGDIWASGWGAYTGALLEQHLPDSRFAKSVGTANLLIAWFKTIMTVARQNITIEVENAPLVRTKTRSPGEQRTARARVVIDFPKGDALKAIRAAANLSSLDLQLPDGGPIGGAKVVWRLPEGSYNAKYQTANGGSSYQPELAVVQFGRAGGKAAYVSTTNDSGEATITLEGVPQRKNLPPSVRPYPRRAAVAVEVTLKVGNLTQDLNDAIGTAMGGAITGGLGFVADMVLRTSFFFQKSQAFEVRDWKEPAWEGEFEIIVKAAGSKTEEDEKGGPPAVMTWKMDRLMEGRLHTPDWAEQEEADNNYQDDGRRHRLEIDGDSRYFRLSDASSARSPEIDNRYEAEGPLQIQPSRPDQIRAYSRSEPSGSAELLFTGGMMQLDLQPFFGAECLVARTENNAGRSSNRSGPEYLNLLGDVYPTGFTIVEPHDPSQETIEGTKSFNYRGSLPYVPDFDAEVTIHYRLWKNGPPPKNKTL